jgi:hypothetical protein
MTRLSSLGAIDFRPMILSGFIAASTMPSSPLRPDVPSFPRTYQAPPRLADEIVGRSSGMEPAIVLTPRRAEDETFAQLFSLEDLGEGWDGEGAAPPTKAAINDAANFLRSLQSFASSLEPALHADGSVLLELNGGLDGAIRFRGDGTAVRTLTGVRAAVTPIDDPLSIDEVKELLAALYG